MPIFFLILGAMVAFDLLWWRQADRLLRPLPHGRWWRTLLGLFMGGQLFLILWAVGARFIAAGFDGSTPVTLIAATYVWHLLVLPVLVVLLLTAGLVGSVRSLGRLILRALSPSAQRPLAPSPGTPGEGRGEGLPAGLPVPALSRRQILGAAVAAMPPIVTGVTVAASMTGL